MHPKVKTVLENIFNWFQFTYMPHKIWQAPQISFCGDVYLLMVPKLMVVQHRFCLKKKWQLFISDLISNPTYSTGWGVLCPPVKVRYCENHLKSSSTLYIQNHIFTFYGIAPHWHYTVSQNPSSCKTRTFLFYIVNIMAADDLTTQGARASANMIFTMLNQIISVPTC